MDEISPFFRLFLAISRRLESIAMRLGPPITIEESQILTFIHARNAERKPATAQEICDLLKLEKSSLSRKLARLADLHYLERAKGASDKRTKLLELSAEGEAILARDQETRNRQIEEFSAPLSIAERRELTMMVRLFADNLEATEVSSDSADHPLKIQIARLTRSLGFLGGDLFGTGFPLEECQLFAVLQENPGGILLTKLKEELPYDKSKMSRLIQSYETRGFVASTIDFQDKRKVFVTLSKKGAVESAAVQASARKLFEKGLSSLPPDSQKQFQRFLERIIEAGQESGERTRFKVKPIASERERCAAREFLLREIVRLHFEADAPVSFVHPGSELLGAFEGEALCAVLEWTVRDGKARIENLVSNSDVGFGAAAAAALRSFRNTLRSDQPVEIAAPYLSKFLSGTGVKNTAGSTFVENFDEVTHIISVG